MTARARILVALFATFSFGCAPYAAPAQTAAPTPPTSSPTIDPRATGPAAQKPTVGYLTPETQAATTTPTARPTGPLRGGILKVGLQADPVALDPQKSSLTALFHVTEHVYDGLLRLQADLVPTGDLAEKWQISSDGKTYSFTLRKGVRFHNGRALAASDVKYSLERLVDRVTASPQASRLASMETVEAPDEGSVVITLKRPDAGFLASLAHPATVIVPKEEVERNGDLSRGAVGTGPFKLKEYVPNTRVVLERNQDYRDVQKPYLDGIEMTIISDDSARSAAVRTGTVDFIEYTPLKDISILKADATLNLVGAENTNIRFIALNTQRKPFDNVKIRQAVAATIAREAVVDAAVSGQGIPSVGIFPPGYWAGLSTKAAAPDIPRAKQLLAEAGYPSGFKATIQSSAQYSFLSNAALVVQEQLRQIGVETDVDLQENAVYIQNYLDNNFDLSVTGASTYVDPNDIFLGNFQTGQRGNATRYSNSQVDKLILDGIATTDLESRKKIYAELQRILLDEAPWVNLYIANQFEAMKSYVKGYTHNPAGWNLAFKDVWLDK